MEISDGLYLRKARKSYVCKGYKYKGDIRPEKHILAAASKNCLGDINAGDKYIECYWESPVFQSGDRYCLECAKTHLGLSEETLKQFIK